MKKIIFDANDKLLKIIDEAVLNDGFNSRSEFFRFLIINYANEKCTKLHNGGVGKDEPEEVDEFADVDLEFGIPEAVIEKLKKKAAVLTENEQQQLS